MIDVYIYIIYYVRKYLEYMDIRDKTMQYV